MKGIRRIAGGRWQVFARRDGHFLSKVMPADATPDQLNREREKLIGRQVLGLDLSAKGRPFREDAAEYLKLVAAMPSYADRVYRIGRWVDVFGDLPRGAITAKAIATTLEDWRAAGSERGGPLSPASLNQRRTALMHLYTKLDGKSAANIVRDVAPYPEDSGDEIRAQPIRTWYRLLVRLGRRHWRHRRKAFRGTKRPDSKARARLRVLLWTGLPHKQLGSLKPEHVDLKHGRIWVKRRRKGKGHAAGWKPLLPPAITALKRFAALDCWGEFSNSSLHSALARAVKEENAWRAKHGKRPLPSMRPYDARHTFGTMVATLTNDERALQDLMLHSTPQQSRRYTRGSDDVRMAMAVATIKERLSDYVRTRGA